MTPLEMHVVVRHTIPTPKGPFAVCEWFTVEDGLITSCRAYFDRKQWDEES